MTSVKFIIHAKRLGFTLDKNKPTPTIDKISPGGALEKLLIENCSDITKGTQIMTIGGYDVMNMSYSDAVEKIRSLNERPINIVFLTNKKVEKISEETMNDISESATREALRDLSLAAVLHQIEDVTESDNDSNNDSGNNDDNDSDEYYVTIQKYENLEKKYHYLQLELMTKSHEYEDKCTYIQNKYLPISNVDGILCQLDGLKKRIDNIDSRLLTSRELKIKLDKFDEEYAEYIKTLENSMKLVKLNMIQTSVKVYIENDIESMKKMYNRYKIQIMIKNMFEVIQTFSTIVVIIGIIYTIRPYY